MTAERVQHLPIVGQMESSTFRAAMRLHAAGATVITADAGDGPAGLTATSVSSVSADPPLLTFSLSDSSSSAPAILRAKTVVIHLIEHSELLLAELFAASGVDRFADLSAWSRLATGEPYLVGVRTRIRAVLVDRMRAGTSTIALARAIDGVVAERSEAPVVYHDRTWHILGRDSAADVRRGAPRA